MRALAVLFVCAFCIADASAGQKNRNAPDPNTIQLPADFTIDYQLAMNNRARVMGGATPVTGYGFEPNRRVGLRGTHT